MKTKIRRKKKAFKQWYIFIILVVILVSISSSYALWSTKLNINGVVTGKKEPPSLPVEIPSQGTDSNGVNRYTSNTTISIAWQECYRVVDEEYSGNTITTTIQQVYKQVWFQTTASVSITLQIPNNTNSTFTDGNVELVEYKDANSIFQNVKGTLASTDKTISPGGTETVTISGSLKGYTDVAENTYYNFVISYKVDGITYYFYYNIIFKAKA
jgi:hypothetical protein